MLEGSVKETYNNSKMVSWIVKITTGKIRTFCILALVSFLSSCATQIKYFPTSGVQTGIASWYGSEFHGRKTSNNEIYDMYDMTAAHNSLPFGTYVMVTNLNNGKSVTVRINDRGPFSGDRIIDLSYAAAKILDMVASGTAPVRIEVLEYFLPQEQDQKFSVQVGAFIFKENARALKKELQKRYENVYISLFETSSQTYYRVRLRTESRNSALKIAQKLLDEGYTVIVLEEE